jgi:WD40 repeat protein
MSAARLCLLLAACLILGLGQRIHGGPAPAKGEKVSPDYKPARTDRYGDPLPPGAIARLGTGRLRHSSEVWSAVFSADDKTLVSAGPVYGEDTKGLGLRFWDVGAGRLARQIDSPRFVPDRRFGGIVGLGGGGPEPGFQPLSLSSNGKTLAASDTGSSLDLWDLAKRKPIRQLRKDAGQDEIHCVAISPDGKTLACCGKEKDVELWQAATGKRIGRLGDDEDRARSVAFSPDGKTLAVAFQFAKTRLFSLATAREIRRFPSRSDVCVAFSPGGKLLATAWKNKVRLWQTATGKKVRVLRVGDKDIQQIAFSPDGKLLACADSERFVRLWEVATGKELRRLRAHRDYVCSVAFSHNGKILATTGEDHRVKLWEVATGKEIHPFPTHQGDVLAMAYSPDGKLVASASEDHTVRLWEAATGKAVRVHRGHDNEVICVTFSSDGKALISGSWDGVIRCWEVGSGKGICSLTVPHKNITSLSFSDGGKILASTNRAGTVRIWKLSTDQRTLKAQGEKPLYRIGGLALSPNGTVLASSSNDLPLGLWEAATRKQLGKLAKKPPFFSPLCISADRGTLAAKVFGGEMVCLWNLTTRKELATLEQSDIEAAKCIALSPDGRLLALGGYDGVTSLWEVASAQKVARFQGPKKIHSLAFSPDGRTVAAGDGEDCTIVIWDVTGRAAEDKQRPGALMPSKELSARRATWPAPTPPGPIAPSGRSSRSPRKPSPSSKNICSPSRRWTRAGSGGGSPTWTTAGSPFVRRPRASWKNRGSWRSPSCAKPSRLNQPRKRGGGLSGSWIAWIARGVSLPASICGCCGRWRCWRTSGRSKPGASWRSWRRGRRKPG